jgi:hypothetical protein
MRACAMIAREFWMEVRMRAAILLSGHLRTHQKLYANFRKTLLDVLQADIFIHTWSTIDSTTPTWWREEPPAATLTDPELLRRMYCPKLLEIEEPRDFYKITYESVNQHSTLKYQFVVSMWYSWWKAMQLCRQYEFRQGFKYDLVFRTRGDVEILGDIRMHTDTVVTGWHGDPQSLCDVCAYGPSRAIAQLVDIYLASDDYAKVEMCCRNTWASPVQICPEFALKNYCDRVGLSVTKDPGLKRFLHRLDGHIVTHLNN